MDINFLKKIKFVKLASKDADDIYEIELQCFSLPWTSEQYKIAFTQKTFLAFGVRFSKKLIAYISLYHTTEQIEILNIAVLPEFRRHGIGRKLLGLLLQIGNKMGIVDFVLEVRESNAPAIALYEDFNFIKSGKRAKYYTDNNEDALVYIYKL